MKDNGPINLFVRGRLCLFGEHSDWAGMYRSVNSNIARGAAIVSGTEQGIYAVAEKNERFIMNTAPDLPKEHWECDMDSEKLLCIAEQGDYFSYVAGVVSFICDNYNVGGAKITILKRDLPQKRGLASSAAICVLVARAFNQLYNLNMNTKEEMNVAFQGESCTPSRCGRLDQACAYGNKPILMYFDEDKIKTRELRVGSTFYWVIADLMATKDTIKILSDLSKAYPFARNKMDKNVQEALGIDNQRIINNAIAFLESGDAEGLGKLMIYAQKIFDEKVAPACSELKAPILHSVLNDPLVKPYIYGGKGVGSQGDGTVQFLAKGKNEAKLLQDYLYKQRGMQSFALTLKPSQSIKKAIIPLAGFGTRVFPATKIVRKCFMPLLDKDGVLKPALMIMLEQLLDAGIEDICLVIGEDEQEEFERFFGPLSREHFDSLSEDMISLEERILKMRRNISFVKQRERLGFGHAVWLTRQFADNEPILLLLGDFVYSSNSIYNCCTQIIDAYKACGKTLVGIKEITLDNVVHYGILHGVWDGSVEALMKVDKFVEKPTPDYAKSFLGVRDKKNCIRYYATFGQYVLTPDVYLELDKQIKQEEKTSEGNEYGLTSALDAVREKHGLYAFVPDGKSFDIGLPEAYRETVWNFYKNNN
ncbi:UTP-glucose-1-phosphate uridylyltransferase [Lachnospiraceae bacterium NE2001]|nr:UTP-glucose-1-phosphate uridylyltransferase [Lachnospiraceae bacterium NE2001]